MADDKQKYSYRPNIEYQDTYESDARNKQYESAISPKAKPDTDIGINNHITNNFNDLSKVIPLLPAELQTSINNVYKPILDTWKDIKDIPYPIEIPDPDGVKFVTPEPKPTPTPSYNYDPTPGGSDDGGGDPEIPTEDPVSFLYPYPPGGYEPTEPEYDKKDYPLDNDGMWDFKPSINIEFTKADPVEVIEKEYIKNLADLFDYFVDRLKDIIYHYYSERTMATYAKKKDSDGNMVNKTLQDVIFLVAPITVTSNSVKDECKHLLDASLAMGEKASLKLNFLQNAFPVEQTLLHLKTFKTIQLLRKRYAEIEQSDGKDKIEALSNNVLKGMNISYDQKYDYAFANLYKYFNSFLDILEDTINTELSGLKSRRTLIEKGGFKE